MDFYFSPTGLQDLSEVLCSTDRILLGVETPNSTDGISRGGENVAENLERELFQGIKRGVSKFKEKPLDFGTPSFHILSCHHHLISRTSLMYLCGM